MKTIRTRDVESLDQAHQVASILSHLSAKARQANKRLSRDHHGTTFCGYCGGSKDRRAMRCRSCTNNLRRQIHSAATWNSETPPRIEVVELTRLRAAASLHSTRHVHSEGAAHLQPTRPRMVKQADGTWAPFGGAEEPK